MHVVDHPEKQCTLHFPDEVKSLFVASDFPELADKAFKIEGHLSSGCGYAEFKFDIKQGRRQDGCARRM